MLLFFEIPLLPSPIHLYPSPPPFFSLSLLQIQWKPRPKLIRTQQQYKYTDRKCKSWHRFTHYQFHNTLTYNEHIPRTGHRSLVLIMYQFIYDFYTIPESKSIKILIFLFTPPPFFLALKILNVWLKKRRLDPCCTNRKRQFDITRAMVICF